VIEPSDLTTDQRKVVLSLYRARLARLSAHATVEEMRELAAFALPFAACGTRAMPAALVDLTLRDLGDLGVTVEVQPGCWAFTADAGESFDKGLLAP